MSTSGTRRVIIAGAGIAGLTAALAFADSGAEVCVFERSPALRDIGAGLQLSPNATRILQRLGVLERLEGPVRPPAVLLRDAATLREIARVPLGTTAEARWGAPYLVAHRADLQQALIAAVASLDKVELITGAKVRSVEATPDGVTAVISTAKGREHVAGDLMIGADGVWSGLRKSIPGSQPARFAGQIAWRRTVPAKPDMVRDLVPDMAVGAFLNPRFHVVCYPIRGGREINLVAFTRGEPTAEDWTASTDPAPLLAALDRCAPPLAALAAGGSGWTAYPLHTVSPDQRWTAGRLALIGDAAHALTPFAAQGAAMAIEDAAALARCVAGAAQDGMASALAGWEALRRARVTRVRRRGALNELAWHASGPVALARNLLLSLRAPERLAADLDWLYGFDAQAAGSA